jgi:imidazolonepropionase-like amidohydrolase
MDKPLLPPSKTGLWAGVALGALALVLWHGQSVPGEAPRGHRSLLHDVMLCAPGSSPDSPLVDLLWEDGVIIAVGPPRSLDAKGALEINGRGRWIAPALCDGAVFLSLEGRQAADSVPAGPRQSLEREAEAGVSLAMDLNAHRAFIQSARALEGPLPTVLFAGALYSSPGGWRLIGQTPWESHVFDVIEPEDLDAPWSRAVRFGDQAVFASVEHEGRDSLGIPLPTLQRLGSLAHGRGLPFIIHVNHSAKALEALSAKPDAIVGPLLEAGDGRLAAALRAQGVLYMPSLSALLNAFPSAPGQSVEAWLGGFPAALSLSAGVLDQATAPDRLAGWVKHWTRMGAVPSQVLGVPRAMLDAGVGLAFGSGSGRPLVFHGLGVATELAHLRRAGLRTDQILEMSARTRSLLGHPGGYLRPGEAADLLLLNGDPWADPSLLAHPDELFLGGVRWRP